MLSGRSKKRIGPFDILCYFSIWNGFHLVERFGQIAQTSTYEFLMEFIYFVSDNLMWHSLSTQRFHYLIIVQHQSVGFGAEKAGSQRLAFFVYRSAKDVIAFCSFQMAARPLLLRHFNVVVSCAVLSSKLFDLLIKINRLALPDQKSLLD